MDQSQNEPGSGDATAGRMDDPARREPSGTPGLRERARESVRDAREQVTSKLRDRADSAREGATRVVDERKRTFADSVHALASAFDAAAASLTDGNQAQLADWTRELSGRARRIASYLEESDTRGLVTDLEGSARSHPAAFLGTSFAAGVAAGRFLRSSARANETSSMGDERSVDLEFAADDSLGSDDATGFASSSSGTGSSDPGRTSFSGGYGNPGSGYGQTGSSVGATRTGLGDAGFGPTRVGPARHSDLTTGGHLGTGGDATGEEGGRS